MAPRALLLLLGLTAVTAPASAQPAPWRDRALEHLDGAARDLAGACAAGTLRACYDLGVMFQTGTGVRLDYARARVLFQHACDGNDTYACNGLARLYERGHGVRRDPALALRFFDRACDGGDAPVCYYLGYLHEHGQLAAADVDRARRYYTRSCDGGYRDACTALTLPPFASEAELSRRLSDFLGRAGEAAVASTVGAAPPPAQWAGPASRDLRASTRAPAGVTSVEQVRTLATVWFVRWVVVADEDHVTQVDTMALRLPSGELRWASAAAAQHRDYIAAIAGGEPDLNAAPPELWWPVTHAFRSMRDGGCALAFATPAEVAALPARVRSDFVQTPEVRRLACSTASHARGEQVVPVPQWLGVLVESGGGTWLVRTGVNVEPGGAVWLDAASWSPL